MLDIFKTLTNAILEKAKSFKGDWNENDSFSPHYIRNRTHWTEQKLETLLDIKVETMDEGEEYYYSHLDLSYPIEVGRTYQISLNGVKYECKAFTDRLDTMLGNGRFYGVNKGEDVPFIIVFYDDPQSECWINALEPSMDIKITTMMEKVHKIDEKYLPDVGVGQKGEGKNAEIFNNYDYNIASGEYSHAEGDDTNATGDASHAEGCVTIASGWVAHAEGENTVASASSSHAEGLSSQATGFCSHAEGRLTKAEGYTSHAEGDGTHAKGDHSHAEGYHTIAGYHQHVQGKYNIEDTEEKYAHIVGNGIGSYNRSNAHTLDWNGNAWFAGDIFVGSDNRKVDTIGGAKDYVLLQDQTTGEKFALQMRNRSLVTTMVASKIRVVALPHKTTYMNGDGIDLTGLQLQTIADDGTISFVDVKDVQLHSRHVDSNLVTLIYDDFGTKLYTSFNVNVVPFDRDAALIDFDYITNEDGTYTITDWKGTYKGEPSTKIILPDNKFIIL